MFVTWDPGDGSEVAQFHFDPEDMLSKEAVLIEKEYGNPIEVWVNGLRAKEAKARRILLWWHIMQTHKGIRFADVPDFRMRQMKVEMDVAELQELWKRLSQTKMDDDRRDQLRSAFEVDLRDAMARDGIYEGEVVLEPGDRLPKPASPTS